MKQFYGTGVAMVTPFQQDGSVDYDGLGRLIDYLIDGGVDYLVSLGTTGESATLSKDEKQRIWNYTAEKNNRRVPLVAGIGGNYTAEITRTLESFDATGFDAILSVSPYYNKPTQEGIYQHYKALAECSTLPIILYNVPGRTRSNMLPETILRLANDFQNIIAIKEASGNFDQFNKIAKDKPDDFLLISGDDPITIPMIAIGAAGVISVVANALPRQFSNMVRDALDGNFREALPTHYSLIDFTNLLFAEGNPAGVKAALEILGICNDTLRLPLVKISDATRTKIKEEIKHIHKKTS